MVCHCHNKIFIAVRKTNEFEDAAPLRRFSEHPAGIEVRFSFHNFMASAVVWLNLSCRYALVQEATLAVSSLCISFLPCVTCGKLQDGPTK